MSTISDYKLYKQYEPAYKDWRKERSIKDAKRLEYLKQNPSAINQDDIKKGRALVRAIDIMDEYSQKYAQNMEMANSFAVGTVMELTMIGGIALGLLLGRMPIVKNFLSKFIKAGKNEDTVNTIFLMAIGGALSTIAALPLYSRTAKAEIEASRKGRFEAMQKNLVNPNVFAVLSDEQIEQAKNLTKNIQLEEDTKSGFSKIFGKMNTAKKVLWNSKEYKKQRAEFEMMLQDKADNVNKPISAKDAEDAKKDQQLLTKLVDKIDIASQDYAENAELSAGILTSVFLAGGILVDFIVKKLTELFKIKFANKISAVTRILSALSVVGASIFGSSIAKEASRVGRYKAKQEFLNNPASFAYVDDEKINTISDVKINTEEKSNWFKFLKTAYKDKKEYDNYKKTKAKNDERFYKAVEKLKLTPEQIKDAKRLQTNTFMTFNKIDQESQKFSENIEALGLTAEQPVSIICSLFAMAFGMPIAMKPAKTSLERAANMSKYMGIIFLSLLPVMFLNYFVTKEQKKASRVADMMAINEMQDYRLFRA